MAKMPTVSIGLDIEPVVEIVCANQMCRFNLANHYNPMLHCQLKIIELGKKGECLSQEKLAANNRVNTDPATPSA